LNYYSYSHFLLDSPLLEAMQIATVSIIYNQKPKINSENLRNKLEMSHARRMCFTMTYVKD